MSDKVPQPTRVLVSRLRRVAKALDALAKDTYTERNPAAWRAFANTCLQAAGRLEDYRHAHPDLPAITNGEDEP